MVVPFDKEVQIVVVGGVVAEEMGACGEWGMGDKRTRAGREVVW